MKKFKIHLERNRNVQFLTLSPLTCLSTSKSTKFDFAAAAKNNRFPMIAHQKESNNVFFI